MQRRDPEGAETAAIAALVNLDGKRVLEVGCGGGRLAAVRPGTEWSARRLRT